MEHLVPLDRTALDALGIPEGWNFGRADICRFSELDPLNHANNAGYLSWIETARVGYLDWIGFERGAGAGLRLVLKASTLEFHAPVHLNETYVVCVRTTKVGRTSFTTEYAIFVEGRLTTTSTAVMVCVEDDIATTRPLSDKARAQFIADGAIDAR